jgi:cysteine desulfurase
VTVALDLAGVASSTGSACVSGSTDPSHVLSAMGYPAEEARGALRFSLGRTTTAAEIAEAAETIVRILALQRDATGLPAPAGAPPVRLGRREAITADQAKVEASSE